MNADVLFDATPLDRDHAVRGIGAAVRGMAEGLAALPADVAKHIRLGQLGEAFAAPERVVLVDWLQALAVDGVDPGRIVDELPFMGVVLKKQADLDIARRHMAVRARRAAMQRER